MTHKTRAGEQNPNAKLTGWQITAIRYLHDVEGHSQLVLGEWFGVTRMQISRIVRRENWSHLRAQPEPPAPPESPLALMDALVSTRRMTDG